MCIREEVQLTCREISEIAFFFPAKSHLSSSDTLLPGSQLSNQVRRVNYHLHTHTNTRTKSISHPYPIKHIPIPYLILNPNPQRIKMVEMVTEAFQGESKGRMGIYTYIITGSILIDCLLYEQKWTLCVIYPLPSSQRHLYAIVTRFARCGVLYSRTLLTPTLPQPSKTECCNSTPN